MEFEVDEPNDTYHEIKELINLHFKYVTGRYTDEKGFAATYPNIYRLYLRIAANGLNK